MSESFEPIRSYQRIFRPERRIYQIEGRTLPVPGGVPLRWLAYATATLLAVIALGSGSATVDARHRGGRGRRRLRRRRSRRPRRSPRSGALAASWLVGAGARACSTGRCG